MVESIHSGYHDGTGLVADFTAVTQPLDSLAVNEYSSLSLEIDNTVNLWQYADIQIDLGSAAFTGGAASLCHLYLVPLVDNTAYPSWIDNVLTDQFCNENYLIGSPATTSTTTAQTLVLQKVELSPKFKVAIRNKTGAAFNITGNTITLNRWGWASA